MPKGIPINGKNKSWFKKGVNSPFIPWNKGKKLSKQHILNLKISHKGQKVSEETRGKMSEFQKGRKHKPMSQEQKEYYRKLYTGKKHTENTKKKLRENNCKFWLGKKRPEWSEYTRKKHEVSKTEGEKHWNWRGGVTPINEKIRRSTQYKLWKKAVLERDKYVCIWCGSKEKIHADHIKPFSLYPELRFAIDNGRALCEQCHRTTETYGGRCKYFT